ncbi:hypothetical protein DEO72_LG4g155 [Vigna unguiculata]|uniref:Uncharacterized protein n=1 Tax=Vigna unguiculata TaxID=3917 RepID=A0A4D6LLN3_VIGUN|nr:hypothetical protein DEO72_LG4g155 [Vigna unguiculata]
MVKNNNEGGRLEMDGGMTMLDVGEEEGMRLRVMMVHDGIDGSVLRGVEIVRMKREKVEVDKLNLDIRLFERKGKIRVREHQIRVHEEGENQDQLVIALRDCALFVGEVRLEGLDHGHILNTPKDFKPSVDNKVSHGLRIHDAHTNLLTRGPASTNLPARSPTLRTCPPVIQHMFNAKSRLGEPYSFGRDHPSLNNNFPRLGGETNNNKHPFTTSRLSENDSPERDDHSPKTWAPRLCEMLPYNLPTMLLLAWASGSRLSEILEHKLEFVFLLFSPRRAYLA